MYRLTYRPRHKHPLGKWLERQGRFAHLALLGNEHLLETLQEWVDFEWDLLLRKCDEIPEDQWDKASSRHKAEPFVMHPSRVHLESLGEPLTASMTYTALDWDDFDWGRHSGMQDGAFEDWRSAAQALQSALGVRASLTNVMLGRLPTGVS